MSSAMICVTKTRSSLSLLSPSLVMAMAVGFPPTGAVPTTLRLPVSMMDTVPSVWLAT